MKALMLVVYKWRIGFNIHIFSALMDFYNIIKSFLGPNKCLKFISEDDQVEAVSCPADYLSLLPYQNSLSQFVNCTVQSHHDKYINSTATLITYIYLFHNVLQESIKRDNNLIENCKKLRSDLEGCTKYLKSQTYSMKNSLKTQKNDAKKEIYISPSMQRLLKTSRYFNLLNYEEDSVDDSNYQIEDSVLKEMKKIVDRVCHGDRENEISSLVMLAWINQVEKRKCRGFTLDASQIQTQSLLGNPFCSRVISGILIPTYNLNDIFFTNSDKLWRGLLISGSLKYNCNHRGYNESIRSRLVLTADNLSQRTQSQDWIDCILEKLKKMQVNLLLIQGSADDKLLDRCFSAQIIIITNINDKLLHSLSSSLSISIENYILDCDESNIILDISLERLTLENTRNCDNYLLLKVPQQIQTIIIYSSCTPIACAKEHSIRHFLHRLSAALSSAIDGKGKAEEQCIAWLRAMSNEKSLLIHVFQQFLKLLQDNCQLSSKDHDDVLDAFAPKIEAWLSALQVAVTLVSTDTIALTGDKKGVWKCIEDCKYNFVGYL